MLKAYIYACYRYMSSEEYKMLLQKSQVYQGIDMRLREEIAEIEQKMRFSPEEDTLEKWKEQYRK